MVTNTSAVLASSIVPDTARDIIQGADIDDEFFALVYADEQLLRDEFDALMAAAWSDRPPTPLCGRDAGRPPDRQRADLPRTQGRPREGVLIRVRNSPARTRSPPSSTGSGP